MFNFLGFLSVVVFFLLPMVVGAYTCCVVSFFHEAVSYELFASMLSVGLCRLKQEISAHHITETL